MKEASMYEAALKRFIISTPGISETTALACLDSILNAASRDSAVFHQTVSFLEKPFSDPNSFYRNEDLYIEVLKAIMQSSWYDSSGKIRSRHRLQLALQNRVGDPANDFTYITSTGTRKKLYDGTAKNTLLFFYNPECQACKDVKAAIMQSSIINSSIHAGRLQILAIYTEPDLDLWRKYLPEMPVKWITGHDQSGYLYAHDVYDLHAIPTLYLLDKNKKVMLKDCMSIPLIEQHLLQ